MNKQSRLKTEMYQSFEDQTSVTDQLSRQLIPVNLHFIKSTNKHVILSIGTYLYSFIYY